jgi:hypothetical protein
MNKWLDVTIRISVRDDVEDLANVMREMTLSCFLEDDKGKVIDNLEVIAYEEITP